MEAIYENSRSEWIRLTEWLEAELHRGWGTLRVNDDRVIWEVATTEVSGNEGGFFIFKSRKYLGAKFDALCVRLSDLLKQQSVPWVIYCYEYRHDGERWLCSDNPVASISSSSQVFAEPAFSHRVTVEVPDAKHE